MGDQPRPARGPGAADAPRPGLRRGRRPLVAAHRARSSPTSSAPWPSSASPWWTASCPRVALALLAGVGTGAVHAGRAGGAAEPRGRRERLPAATSLYGAVSDFGFTAGPALAARGAAVRGAGATLLVAERRHLRHLGGGAGARSTSARSRRCEADRGTRAAVTARARHARGSCATAGMRGPGASCSSRRPPRSSSAACSTWPSCRSRRRTWTAASVGFSVLVALYGVGFIAGSLAAAPGGARDAAQAPLPAGPVPDRPSGVFASGAAPALVERPLVTFAVGGLRQRADARLRAAADPGRWCRTTLSGARLRREGRAHRVGVRARRSSLRAGLVELLGARAHGRSPRAPAGSWSWAVSRCRACATPWCGRRRAADESGDAAGRSSAADAVARGAARRRARARTSSAKLEPSGGLRG